jgi:hypothetical protein
MTNQKYCNFCGTQPRAPFWLVCLEHWAQITVSRDAWDRSVVLIQGVQVDPEMKAYAPTQD